MRPKIVFSNVSKSFSLYKKQSDKLLEIISLKNNKESFYALKNLSFEIFEGESIGIVGLNGSGKSTLSNLLAQIIPPTTGSIEINGETSLIAISVGLNNQLTGIENIELKCLMHGLKKEEVQRLKKDIIDFADIGKFINQPVKNYSSGMRSRLGFAISIHTNPDILIVDEALSVGDKTFYKKCINKMNEFKLQGKTIIFISHSTSQIKEFCDRAMWMNFGRLEKFGDADTVVKEYTDFIKWFNSLSDDEKKSYRATMLDGQYKEEDTKTDFKSLGRQQNRKRKQPVKKKSNFLFSFQFIIIFLAVLFSASLMFGSNPVKGIGTYLKENLAKDEVPTLKEPVAKETKEVSLQGESLVRKINSPGLVVVGKSVMYNDDQQTNAIGEIPFSAKIDVLEQFGESYKVRTKENAIGYVDAESIKLIDKEINASQREFTDFLPLFPQRFADAYAYFLTFLSADYVEMKSTLNGLTSEKILENGNKFLTYGIYNAHFTVNKENIAESITVSNISVDKDELNDFSDSAYILSDDNLHYFFVTEEYNIILDIEGSKAIISLRD